MLEKKELEMFYPDFNGSCKSVSFIKDNKEITDYSVFIGIVSSRNKYYNIYLLNYDLSLLIKKYNTDKYQIIKWYKEQYLNNI